MGHDHISQTTFGPGEPVTGTTLVFHMDAHGSTRILTDLADSIANLAAQQIFHYTAYGNAINFSMSGAATQYLYSGEQFDSRVGQQYLRARYYNQANGTFNRLDPFFGNQTDPQSFHKYLYTHGDPVNGSDPTGEFNLSISLGNISMAVNNFTYRASAALTTYLHAHQRLATFVTWGSMGLNLYGAYLNPGEFIATGGFGGRTAVAELSDDFFNIARSASRIGHRSFALLFDRGPLEGAGGVVAKISSKAFGRITKLGSKASIDPIGWDELVDVTTDAERARGHLLANWFGGPGDNPLNLVPLFRRANQEMLEVFERPVNQALVSKAFDTVYLRVVPKYKNGSKGPYELVVEALGEKLDGTFESIVALTKISNSP